MSHVTRYLVLGDDGLKSFQFDTLKCLESLDNVQHLLDVLQPLAERYKLSKGVHFREIELLFALAFHKLVKGRRSRGVNGGKEGLPSPGGIGEMGIIQLGISYSNVIEN